MNIRFVLPILFLLLLTINSYAQRAELKDHNGTTRLFADGKPYLMLSGELHNSTSSTLEYLEPVWQKVKGMHLNSVIASVSWEQFEPREGQYDYSMIDNIINLAGKYQTKVALIWFASWKNGLSSYAPIWVKQDGKRFHRVRNAIGEQTSILSPFCWATCDADAKAFAALMRRIKEKDKDNMIVTVQIENEVGCFQDIDYSQEALDSFEQEVPAAFLSYLKKHENTLEAELKDCWTTYGKKMKGNWQDVFGVSPDAKSFFMTWQYASYIQKIAEAGRAELNLPMYVNAWIVQYPGELPGKYPNGGPVSKVMDIYKAAAPDVDWCSPDIYLANYKEICGMYHRQDNPLFIPESTLNPGRAFYAFAEHNAICYAPFGIEDGAEDVGFMEAYAVLKELLPIISNYQGSGKMRGFLKEKGEKSNRIQLGDYEINIVYNQKEQDAYGLIIQTAEDEFLVAGIGARVEIKSKDKMVKTEFAHIWEGRYKDDRWFTTRWLNGDESYHGLSLILKSRKNMVAKTRTTDESLPPQPAAEVEMPENNNYKQMQIPSVYQAKVFSYSIK